MISKIAILKWALPLAFIAGLIALWQILLTSGTAQFIAPTPLEAASGILELWNKGVLTDYIASSIFRVIVGFLVAAFVGIPVGFLMGWNRPVRLTLNPLIQILRPISPIAWIPMSILWFGLTERAPVFLIFMSCVFPITIQTIVSVESIPSSWLKTSENLQLPWHMFFLKVIVPATLPQIVTGLRIALGIGWMVVVAAEMIVVNPRSGGLGYLINDARSAGRYDLVVSSMIAIGTVGLVLDSLIRQLETLEEVKWAQGLKGSRYER